MLTAAFFHGVILACGLILPLGVQNIFVFNQGALHRRFRYALPAIVTASLSDTLLIILAVLGVSLVILSFPLLRIILFSLGFFFLVYMGFSLWKEADAPEDREDNRTKTHQEMRAKKQILFALSVSLFNPHAILDTIGVIGTNSLHYAGKEKAIFTLACILVSWLWFFGLAFIGRIFGARDPSGRWLSRINRSSAIIIWAISLYMLGKLVGYVGPWG
jgi:L-lysine exporter family protein LysE/ArgO